MHQEQFEMLHDDQQQTLVSATNTREDLTLLVRRFNAKLATSRRKKSSKDGAADDNVRI